jgi:hypothetical protein
VPHWFRHLLSTAQTSGSGHWWLKVHVLSAGSWHTFPVEDFTHEAPPLQSALVLHST